MCAFRRVFIQSKVRQLFVNKDFMGTQVMSKAKYTQESNVNTAIMMVNMGGPRTIDQVGNYLLRIMTDRDMIQLPFQSKLGPYIAQRRTAEVQHKYQEIGGGSPLYHWTDLQGKLLCEKLDTLSPSTAPHKHYVTFRYADPLTDKAVDNVLSDNPKRVVIFSQYPQYSCATSGSSINEIYKCLSKRKVDPSIEWTMIDRWPAHPLLVKTFAERIKVELQGFSESERNDVIILFSAHSLPLKAVDRGDSYPSEVGATVQLVMQELGYSNPYCLVWQSKVGPLRWLAPSTEQALEGYIKQGKKNFILVPIAFVNEHIETLHELDIEYCKELKEKISSSAVMKRAAAPNDHPIFISALADIVTSHMSKRKRISPKFLTRCPHCVNQRCKMSKEYFANLCS